MENSNLIPFAERSEDEQRAMRVKGGINSGISRRAKKTFRELLQVCMEIESVNKSTGEKKTVKDISMMALANRCKAGDLKAIKLAAELLGEYKTKVDLETSGTGINVILRDKEVADTLQKVIDIENGDE